MIKKMKTRLFREDSESYTEAANQIANEFDRAIKAVFDKYSDLYYMRELEVIAMSSVSLATCQSVMDSQHLRNEKRKAEQAEALANPNLADKVREFSTFNYPNNQSKINAIKSLRILTGIGLKEAKDWVEANMAEFPDTLSCLTK
jgi:ribosomal protein L7/L12